MFFRRFSHVQRLVVVGVYIFLFSQLQTAVQAAGELTVEQITCDVIGLDSNKPSISGPEYFPVGIRVCNRSGAMVNNLVAKFVWDQPTVSSIFALVRAIRSAWLAWQMMPAPIFILR